MDYVVQMILKRKIMDDCPMGAILLFMAVVMIGVFVWGTSAILHDYLGVSWYIGLPCAILVAGVLVGRWIYKGNTR